MQHTCIRTCGWNHVTSGVGVQAQFFRISSLACLVCWVCTWCKTLVRTVGQCWFFDELSSWIVTRAIAAVETERNPWNPETHEPVPMKAACVQVAMTTSLDREHTSSFTSSLLWFVGILALQHGSKISIKGNTWDPIPCLQSLILERFLARSCV